MIKRVAKYYLPLLVVSLLLSIWIFYNEKKNISNLELKELTLKSNLIVENLNPVIANIFYWSQNDFTKEDFDPRYNQKYEEQLGNFIVGMNHYSQFRFIKKNGEEALRLIRSEDGKIINDLNFQNKKNEGYFKKTIALDSSEIYLSPLNLNIENGKIERPFSPMIRGSAPVFSKSGEKLGMVVINYDAKEILATLTKKLNYTFYLVDSNGKFLANSENNKRAFKHLTDPNNHQDFPTNFPKTWKAITQDKETQFGTGKNFWIVNKLDFKEAISHFNVIDSNRSKLISSNEWYLISRVSNTDVLAASMNFYLALFVLNLISFIIIAYVAKSEIKNEKIKEVYLLRLKKKRKALENQNVLLTSIKTKLELRNRQLKEYNSIVAHNLRAPTTSMSALISMVSGSEDYEEVKTIIPKLNTISGSINTLVQDLLTYVRVLNDDNIKIEKFEIKPVIEQSLCLYVETIDGTVNVEIDLSGWKTIKFSKIYFQSVVQNLISNAIKYRDPTKESYIKIKTIRQKEKRILIVEDNGIGINLEKHQSEIFKLYRRFHRNVSGKGMGLFMVKTQLESLNAEIRVESDYGRGSSFIITFN